MPVSCSLPFPQQRSLKKISDTSDISYGLILVVGSSNTSSEDTDKILAAMVVFCPPQEVSAHSARGYGCVGWQEGWQLAELAAAGLPELSVRL